MRICYFSLTKEPPPRDRVYLRGFRENGAEITECRDSSPGVKKFWRLWKKHRALNGKYDVLLVGFSGHILVPLARLISRKKIVFNALGSLYEGMVVSRGRSGFWGLGAVWYWFLDLIVFRCATVSLVESNAQKEYLKKKFFLSDKKFLRAWTGADPNVFFFDPVTPKLPHFTVLFRGAFMPESGIEYAVEAARILKDKDIRFRIIGNGIMASRVKNLLMSFDAKNVEWISERLSDEDLRRKMQECHLSLGQLTKHDRLNRTIPFKAFESFAMKLPYVTARNRGPLELLTENETCACFEPGNAQDLARKIIELKNNPGILTRLAEGAYILHQEKLRANILARELLEAMEYMLCKKRMSYFKKN